MSTPKPLSLRQRALQLANGPTLPEIPPTRAEALLDAAEELVWQIREARGPIDLIDSWSDVIGFLTVQAEEDRQALRRLKGEDS